MQLSIFIIFLSVFSVSAATYSQSVKLSIRAKDASVSEVFDKIEKQSDFYFFYNKEVFKDSRKITVDFKNKLITDILAEILKNTGMTYEIKDKYIYILKSEEGNKQPNIQQQQIQINGTVTDCSDKTTIPGVSVSIKGTSNGTITDINGKYTLKASPGDVIMFSYIGMKTQEIKVEKSEEIDVELCADLVGLDEVVVIGYGVQKKSDLTGAVASVKSEEIEKIATSNPAEALQGRVAGVNVTKIGGAPGGAVDVKIRGVGTVNNNDPLYIIDGIPGSMFYVNPEDIESIEVLKDGAASAIYGSRAANGVILITTKKGKIGKTIISIGSYVSVNNPVNTFDLLDSKGYQTVHRAMYKAAGQPVPEYAREDFVAPYNTDWIDEVMRTGLTQNYNVRLSGGNELVTYALSGQFMDDKGTMIGSGYKKNQIKARTGIKKGILSLDASITYIESKNEPYKFSLRQVYHISPLTPVYDDTQEYGFGLSDLSIGLPHHTNPVAEDHFKEEYTKTQYIISNFNLTLDLTNWLKWQTTFGLENSNGYDFFYTPPYMANPKEPHQYTVVDEKRSNWRQIQIENLIHFTKSFGKHNFSGVAGVTSFKQTDAFTQADVEGKTINRKVVDGNIMEETVPGGFLDVHFKTLNAGIGGTYNASGTNETYTRASVLGRINYDFSGKYYLQATVRRDGSSKFGENKRYGVFPSFALGWRISNESFVSYDWLDNLKLRASYGVLGNEETIPNYYYQAKIRTYNYYYGGYVRGDGRNPWPGSIAMEMENKDLGWEETASINVGLDFSLFNCLSGSLNYYNNKTSDLLIEKIVAPSSGYYDWNPYMNVGEIVNKGVEMDLSYSNRKKEFKYSVTATFSTLKNEVLELANEGQTIYGDGLKYGTEHFPTQTKVGTEIGAFYLYQTAGIFQSDAEAQNYVNESGDRYQPLAKAGDIKFIDTNNDGVIDDKDKVYSGAGIPKYEYSLNFTGEYKGFDLTVFFHAVSGNKIYNGNRYELEGMDGGRNFLSTTLDYWRPDNTDTDMPRAVLSDPNGNNRESVRFLENGSYLKLKTLQLGYTFPKKLMDKIKVEKLRLYVTGQNLFTLTGYSGLDPEVGRSSVLNTGVDVAIYPLNRSYIFGLQLSF